MISKDGLELVLGVWSRGKFFAERLAQARAAQGDKPMQNDAAARMDGDTCIIPICGPLFRQASLFSDISGATSYSQIGADLAAALADPACKSIVLSVDSPGGEVNGCGELANAIRAAAAVKPLVAYVPGNAASAAYWLASGAREIVCSPTSLLGSIGVVSTLIDDRGAQEQRGEKEIQIISSQSPGKRSAPLDDSVIARVQARIDDMAEVFVSAVATNRGVSVEKVLSDFGQGDVVVGQKAVAAGLADRVGSLDSVLSGLRAKSGTKPPPFTGASMKTKEGAQAEVELVPRADLDAVQAKLTAAQPLLDQVRAMTGKDTVEGQQAELAQIAIRAARAEELQQLAGDERAQLMTRAKAKRIPPVAMRGWEHLSLASLREVVEKTPGLQAGRPGEAPEANAGAKNNVSTPPGGDVVLTDEDRRELAKAGCKTEEQMLKVKRSMVQGGGFLTGSEGKE